MQSFFNKHNIDDVVIAVGVSGGADSLALLWKLKKWADENERKIVALTVDHGLRNESAEEAQYVAEVAHEWGVEHHILMWNGVKPKTGIEEEARKMRYALLSDWCEKNNIKTLAIAHHLYDQAETFFLRLHRGSGLDGLCGMAPVMFMGKLKIIRPLLNEKPENLRKMLKDMKVEWCEDPSNVSDEFLRVRIRKFLPMLKKELGITPERIVKTMYNLACSREFLDGQCQKFIKNNIKNWDGAGYSLAVEQWNNLSAEMCFRVMNCLLKNVAKSDYPPRSDDVLRLIDKMKNINFKSSTLGGCNIIFFDEKIWIVSEQKQSEGPNKKVWQAWLNENPQYKKMRLPYKLRLSLLQNKPIYNQ